jgi:hypothetical protein
MIADLTLATLLVRSLHRRELGDFSFVGDALFARGNNDKKYILGDKT